MHKRSCMSPPPRHHHHHHLFFALLILLLSLFPSVLCDVNSIWPPPTSASWPRSGVRSNYTIVPSTFLITTSANSSILSAAIERYSEIGGLFFPFQATTIPSPSSPRVLASLHISVDSSNEVLFLGVDESYDIQVSDAGTAILHASTVFGALRGIETFAQLIDWLPSEQIYVMYDIPLVVLDSPRFPWRGLLIDTARHFIPVATLQATIDAMSWSKMNTLHWHLYDAKSNPMMLDQLPDLALGAYSNTTVYTTEDMQHVVEYGRMRGIRVVPEMPMPGRTLSWGRGYGSLIAMCTNAQFGEIVGLNPQADVLYDLLNILFQATNNVFIDNYVSLGGEQVGFECWDLLQDSSLLLSLFLNQTRDIIKSQRASSKIISRYDAWAAVPNAADVVEVYKNTQSLSEVLSAGVQALFSAGWHVGALVPVTPTPANNDTLVPFSSEAIKDLLFPLPNLPARTILDFYNVDPAQGETNTTLLSRLLGGLMAVWSYEVDYTNLLSQTWPLAAAPAGRLWGSPESISRLTSNEALDMLSSFRCRLLQRGIDASAVHPDFCPLPPHNSTHDEPPPAPLPYGQYRLIHVALVALFAGIVGIILGTIIANLYRRIVKKLDAQSNAQRPLINNHEQL